MVNMGDYTEISYFLHVHSECKSSKKIGLDNANIWRIVQENLAQNHLFCSFFYLCFSKISKMKSVAENKKSQNLPEYLIYMYQMEDLIRSYGGNLEEIRQYVISHYPISDEEKIEIGDWFSELTSSMQSEQIMQKGHLKKLHELVGQLAEIHWNLLKTNQNYFETYAKAKPHILDAVLEAKGENLGNEIQICLNGIYGLLLCRLLGKKVDPKQLEAADVFGQVLSMLNFYYMQKTYLSEN
jgi:hypothetical protein